ncbi:MAG: Tim44 domain-containing protein [Alphaproteobacteria bacterium]|nr:Tim44 domain-containing protein [Alphaproteobacteria bacterium]
MAFDILILILVVIVIFQKLRSLLGTRPESSATPISQESAAKIFDILMKETMKKPAVVDGGELKAETKETNETEAILQQIPNFNRTTFLSGAQRAFEMIVTSFAKGEIDILKALIGKTLFKKFEDIINQRREEGITAETDFIGFNSVEIVSAKIDKNNKAKIAVRFVSEQANVLRNAEGNIIEGDENFIQTITDIWTFERNINSTTPNWMLVSTKK